MMDDLFFANPWNPLRRPYYAAAAATPQPRMAARAAQRPAARQVAMPMDVEAAAKPRVVSIPVHFVGSLEAKRDEKKPSIAVIYDAVEAEAAVRVQKAFRGFTVRKNVKLVKAVEAEVAKMEKEVEEKGKIRDEKERLKVNEMLMRLLLKLDSVRGIRDYRKKVIKRVIALQERVDSMGSAVGALDSGESPAAGTLENRSSPDEASPLEKDSSASEDLRGTDLEVDEIVLRTDQHAGDAVEGGTTRAEKEADERCSNLEDSAMKDDSGPALDLMHIDSAAEALDHQALAEENHGRINGVTSEQAVEEKGTVDDLKFVRAAVDQMRSDPDTDGEYLDQEAHMEDDRHADSEEMVVSAGDKTHADPVAEGGALDREAPPKEEDDDDPHTNVIPDKNDHIVRCTDREARQAKDEGMKEVMERVAAESGRLKGLLAELCERSAQQCRLMSGLAERVVHLERVVQRMEKENNNRKKKRRTAATQLPSDAAKKQ